MPKPPSYEGGCLCGDIRYTARAAPVFPHMCSCKMCQRWSGAPSVAWVEFALDQFEWTGPAGAPQLNQTSERTQRGHCPKCGSSLCAIDAGYDNISITITSLDRPNRVIPDERHSYKSSRPRWFDCEIGALRKRAAPS